MSKHFKQFSMEKFDICIIGAGPSGYAAAMRALDVGLKVLLIEKNKPTYAFNNCTS